MTIEVQGAESDLDTFATRLTNSAMSDYPALMEIAECAVEEISAVDNVDMGYLMGGAVLTETVFGLPGIGGLAWKAIQQRDLPMVMGAVTFAAVFIILVNLVVDLVYAVLDPRVRYR